MRAIFWKEMADHFGRRRFLFLLGLVVFGLLWAFSVAVRDIPGVFRSTDDLLFLQLFVSSSGVLPPLIFFISFFGPLAGIILGFDSINSERLQGTLARVLAQPVYRDAVYNGKFLAGAATLAIVIITMVISIIGMGMFVFGIPPNGEEIIRIIGFTVISIVFMSLWLAMAMTCSIFFRSTVVSSMVAIGLWVLATFFILLLASAVADFFIEDLTDPLYFQVESWVSRASPSFLFSEATETLLNPGVRSLGPLLQAQVGGLLATPVSATQSLTLVWPHIVAMVSAVAIFLALSYTKFVREEIRS